jgi:hypothetical protein
MNCHDIALLSTVVQVSTIMHEGATTVGTYVRSLFSQIFFSAAQREFYSLLRRFRILFDPQKIRSFSSKEVCNTVIIQSRTVESYSNGAG